MGTARYHKLIKSALCSCFPNGLISGTVPLADRGKEGPCCPPELPTNPCQHWDESCDWAEEALCQGRPLCLKQCLLPSVCPFPGTAETTPVPNTKATTRSHLPRGLQSPSLASEGPVLLLVPRGARDTHVTKAADATWSPDSITSATVTGATAKPIEAPLLEKEPGPSSAPTPNQKPHYLCHPGVSGSRTAPPPWPGHAQR